MQIRKLNGLALQAEQSQSWHRADHVAGRQELQLSTADLWQKTLFSSTFFGETGAIPINYSFFSSSKHLAMVPILHITESVRGCPAHQSSSALHVQDWHPRRTAQQTTSPFGEISAPSYFAMPSAKVMSSYFCCMTKNSDEMLQNSQPPASFTTCIVLHSLLINQFMCFL